jgi:DNA-binding transcriptional ArsR family regulator
VPAAVPDTVFRSLADPTRRAILERLIREGELTVRAITDESGVSQPMVSKHLGVLKTAGLVQRRPEGRETYYSARAKGLAPLVNWLEHYRAFWSARFDRLDDLLKRMDS